VATEIRMPEFAADMTEADLLSWLVKPGDQVEAGELIAEIETEKSTVEFESPVSGRLLEIRVPEGTNGVQVGTVLALVEESDATEPAAEPQQVRPVQTVPEPQELETSAENSPELEPTDPIDAPAQPPAAATALARRLAARAGLDLHELTGSGRGGRVLKADVEAQLGAVEPSAAAEPAEDDTTERGLEASGRGPAATTEAADAAAAAESVPHSRMRRTIATRLSESKRTIPHFYLRVECEIDALLKMRERLNSGETRISINDFVIRAVALAMVEVPDANVSWSDDALLRYQRVDVAVAVATDSGLVTPVVREAERKELVALSSEIRDLSTRARAGTLSPKEYAGGSITVSNLGMYGVESVYPILNPPQSCILGIGEASQRAVARQGELAVATMMACTLSADHRAVDGAIGAQLLGAFKRRIEDPLEMLL
jgi:pyruvate dehydrogenase E2 component (dihydrolipoamide acetyltransferase)